MKLVNKQLSRLAQSWTNRVEREYSSNGDCDSELEDWMQHVILEAERNKDSKRKNQFLSLLKDLSATTPISCVLGDL